MSFISSFYFILLFVSSFCNLSDIKKKYIYITLARNVNITKV